MNPRSVLTEYNSGPQILSFPGELTWFMWTNMVYFQAAVCKMIRIKATGSESLLSRHSFSWKILENKSGPPYEVFFIKNSCQYFLTGDFGKQQK